MPSKSLAEAVHYGMAIKQSECLRSSSKPVRGGTRLLNSPEIEDLVPNQATARALESDLVGRLAKFFPEATPVRIPIKLSRTHSGDENDRGNGGGEGNATLHHSDSVFFQDTVIEFETRHEALFTVDRPLEFADHVLVESNDGLLCAEASVVAVQYHPNRTAVAVRFLKQVPNWIAKS
jgi:hypothetical protein